MRPPARRLDFAAAEAHLTFMYATERLSPTFRRVCPIAGT